MMKFNLYSIWMDYSFYIYAAIFVVSVAAFLFSLRKLLFSSENQDVDIVGFLDEGRKKQENDISSQEKVLENHQPQLFPSQSESKLSPAEEFIKNLYTSISSIDDRIKNIEKSIVKNKNVNNEFVLKFLEDILNDYDSLDKEKIKGRLQFLISDLKKQ